MVERVEPFQTPGRNVPKTALELPQHHVIVVNKLRRDNAEGFWAASAFDAHDGKTFPGL
jgi:hypothetical protein